MELHILIDNLPAENAASDTPKEYYRDGKGICNAEGPYLHHEHGLCIHFSLDGKHWMIDTGASGKALENMQQMYSFGMPVCTIGEIEAVFVSHGHNDHTGGLRHFIESNPDAPIYLHKEIRGNLFFSCRPRPAKTDAAKTNTAQTDTACGPPFAAAANTSSADTPGDSSSATASTSSAATGDTKDTLIKEFRSIGMEQALFAEYEDRFREIESPTRITDKITLIPITGGKFHPTPMGNEFLYKNDFPDNFSHETAILIEHTEGKFAVISPCTHNGILNVLECCRNYITLGNSNFSCTCSTNGKPNNGTTEDDCTAISNCTINVNTTKGTTGDDYTAISNCNCRISVNTKKGTTGDDSTAISNCNCTISENPNKGTTGDDCLTNSNCNYTVNGKPNNGTTEDDCTAISNCNCTISEIPTKGTTEDEYSERGEITHFIGGLHYVDYLSMGEGEKELRAISGVAQTLKAEHPNLKIYSGHCTCAGAGAILKEILGENYSTFRTGTRITIK